jgi:hypothetical protein
MTDITTQVQNYQGNNTFIIKMKDSLSRFGSLTNNQKVVVEKILSNVGEAQKVEMTDDMKKIASYNGTNSFVSEIKGKLDKYGKLSDKQISAAIKQIDKEESKSVVRKINLPAVGDTIKIGRRIGEELKGKHGLKFNPILIDITKVLGVSEKAVRFSGKMTIKRGDVCMCCARTLTDEFSMLTRMGKTCAKHMGVEYITDASQAERFRKEYIAKVEEIGEMEFWVPKSQIKTWNGKHSGFVEMSNNWF